MALVQIDFSPTGGTRKVADIIAEEWEGPVTRVDLSDAKMHFLYAVCYRVSPVCPEGKRSVGIRRCAGAQKGLRRKKRS